MAGIQFSGLASGIDTQSIVDSLIEAERIPIYRLEGDKSYHQARLTASQDFNSKLKALLSTAKSLDTADEIDKPSARISSDEFLGARADVGAPSGTYGIEVHSLANVEKQYTQGVADKDAQNFGTGTITIDWGDGSPIDITVDSENNSLQGIADAINEQEPGLAATIVNDGTGTPYRLVLTGDEAAKSFTITTSLAGGTENTLTMTTPQPASQAHIVVDGINIYSQSNTFTDAIPGVTIDITKADEAATKDVTRLTVGIDENSFVSNVQAFVSSYNSIMEFVNSQSLTEESGPGILLGDSGVNSIKSRLQRLISTPVKDAAPYDTLASVGFKTTSNGTLEVDYTKLEEAFDKSGDNLKSLFIGADEKSGVISSFVSYLDDQTDPIDGFLAGREQSVNSIVDRIDQNIERINVRLDQRRINLTNQFTALENLMSAMNSQSAFLSQQMDLMAKTLTYGKD